MRLDSMERLDTCQTDPARTDEYLDEESGLLFCSKCREPRQKRVKVLGQLFEPRVMCRCQRQIAAQQVQAQEHQKALFRIARNRRDGLPNPELWNYTFENDLGYNPKQMKMALNYVANWEEFRKSSMGLLLWGDVGTGKSFIAGCIANALLDRGVPVLMTNFTRVLNRMTDMYSGSRNAYIDSFRSYQLLIIDDLGVERNSEFAQEQVFNIIDGRYRSQLPMIVTTNLTIEELKNPQETTRARIYSRVMERCTPIRVNDQNIRKLNAAANMDKAKILLEEKQ